MAVSEVQESKNITFLIRQCPACRGEDIMAVQAIAIAEHMQYPHRYRCTNCKRRYTARTQTGITRLRTPGFLIARTLGHILSGMDITSTALDEGITPRTISRWLTRAGQQGEYVTQLFVKSVTPGLVQMDELWTFVQKNPRKRYRAGDSDSSFKGIEVWVWVAFVVRYRLILATHVGGRAETDAQIFLTKVKQRLAAGNVLFTTDAFTSYERQLAQLYTVASQTDTSQGHILYGIVKKRHPSGTSSALSTELRWGTDELAHEVLKDVGLTSLGTSYVERSNLTQRQNLSLFKRKSLAFAKQIRTVAVFEGLFQVYYNFCRVHKSLRVALPLEEQGKYGKKWLARTPAMAAGLTDHIWSLADILAVQVPYTYDPFAYQTRSYTPDVSLSTTFPADAFVSHEIPYQVNTEVLPSVTGLFSEFSPSEEMYVCLIYKDWQGQVSERIVRLLAFERMSQKLVLKAYCYLRRELRYFRIDRIQRYVLLGPAQLFLPLLPAAQVSLRSVSREEPPVPVPPCQTPPQHTHQSFAPVSLGIDSLSDHPTSDSDDLGAFPSKKVFRRREHRHTGSLSVSQSVRKPQQYTPGSPVTFLRSISDKAALIILQFLFLHYPEPQLRQWICIGTSLPRTTIYDALKRLERYGLVKRRTYPSGSRGRPQVKWELEKKTLHAMQDPP